MAITQLVGSITRNGTYPASTSITASNKCGTLCFIPTSDLTQQMISELPSITLYVKLSDGSTYSAISVDLSTINNSVYSTETQSNGSEISYPYSPQEAYCIPLFNVPESCTFEIEPLFDKYALSAHNADIDNGNVSLFKTVNGIVSDGLQDKWTTPTDTFPISIVFDYSNINAVAH